jgi:hypothetical protein
MPKQSDHFDCAFLLLCSLVIHFFREVIRLAAEEKAQLAKAEADHEVEEERIARESEAAKASEEADKLSKAQDAAEALAASEAKKVGVPH